MQNVGQIIGETLKRLDDERFIVKASSGPRYVVGCRNKVNKDALKAGKLLSVDSNYSCLRTMLNLYPTNSLQVRAWPWT